MHKYEGICSVSQFPHFESYTRFQTGNGLAQSVYRPNYGMEDRDLILGRDRDIFSCHRVETGSGAHTGF
jgi:hypothetical protein